MLKNPIIINTLDNFITYRHRHRIGLSALFLVAATFLFWRISTLPAGLSNTEAIGLLHSSELSNIIDNPINWHYNLLQYLVLQITNNPMLAARLPSAIYAAAGLTIFYYLIKTWHRPRIAVATTLLMASSSWFLGYARFGSDAIVAPVVAVAIFALLTWFRHTHRTDRITMLLLAVMIGVSFYTPFSGALALLAMAYFRQPLMRLFRNMDGVSVSSLTTALFIVLLPLVVSLIKNPNIIAYLLGYHPNQALEFSAVPLNIIDTFAHIFWRSKTAFEFHLANLSMLDLFTTTMTALGLYYYEHQSEQLRSKFLIVSILSCMFLVSVSGNQSGYALLVPFVYFFVTTGLITLIAQWHHIFPKNPFARAIAILPVGVIILTVVHHHAIRYFVAWNQNGNTRSTFSNEALSVRNHIQGLPEKSAVSIVATPISLDQMRASMLGHSNSQTISGIYDNQQPIVNDPSITDYIYLPETLAIDPDIANNFKTYSFVASDHQKSPVSFRVYKKVNPSILP